MCTGRRTESAGLDHPQVLNQADVDLGAAYVDGEHDLR
jgi:hypothetical protein